MLKKFLLFFLLIVISSSALAGEGDLEMKVFTLDYGDPEEVYEAVREMKSPDGKINVVTATRNIIVYDYPDNIARIGWLVKKLDARPEQVVVNVRVEEVTSDVIGLLGLTYGQVVVDPEEFEKIRYLMDKQKTSTSSSEMVVTTLSREPATIAVSENRIYGGTVEKKGNHLLSVPQTERKAGNFLEVLPVVNRDGTITVTIRPEVSEFLDERTVHERSVLTRVTIANGDTIALGGVRTEARRTRQNGVSGVGISIPTRGDDGVRQTVMFLTLVASK